MNLRPIINILIPSLLSLSAMAQLPADYESLNASQKQELIFNEVKSSAYSTADMVSAKNPGFLSMTKLFFPSYLAKSFTNPNDEFKKSKVKLIHTYGGVAKVKFNITKQTKYTGVFQTGATGIMRLSLAKLGLPYTPGIAIKFLIDGRKSENIFAMDSLDGQKDNYNFFAKSFKSKISDPESGALKLLAKVFKKTLVKLGSEHGDPTFQSSRHMSEVRKDGSAVAQPVAPFSLVFQPTTSSQMSSAKGNLLIRLSNAQYSKGLVLYKVFARDLENSELEEIGNIELESRIIGSKYGDKILYFQHNID